MCGCTRAIILLHESHARFDLGIGGCNSTYKIHEASRAILELIYSLRAGTSFDITLLEPSAVVRFGDSVYLRKRLMLFSEAVLLVHRRPCAPQVLGSCQAGDGDRRGIDTLC